MNWKLFIGASIIVGGSLLRVGAPVIAVVSGVILATVWNLIKNKERRVA
ncbi:MAG: hypothetical protein ABI824_05215 [Acidobacteriota bacterium]